MPLIHWKNYNRATNCSLIFFFFFFFCPRFESSKYMIIENNFWLYNIVSGLRCCHKTKEVLSTFLCKYSSGSSNVNVNIDQLCFANRLFGGWTRARANHQCKQICWLCDINCVCAYIFFPFFFFFIPSLTLSHS